MKATQWLQHCGGEVQLVASISVNINVQWTRERVSFILTYLLTNWLSYQCTTASPAHITDRAARNSTLHAISSI